MTTRCSLGIMGGSEVHTIIIFCANVFMFGEVLKKCYGKKFAKILKLPQTLKNEPKLLIQSLSKRHVPWFMK